MERIRTARSEHIHNLNATFLKEMSEDTKLPTIESVIKVNCFCNCFQCFVTPSVYFHEPDSRK